MDDFIGNNIKFLAEWGQIIVGVLIIFVLLLMYLIGKRNKYFLPNGFLGWIGCLLLFLLIIASSLIFARITMVKPGVMVIINELESVKGNTTPPLTFRFVSDNSIHNIEDYKGELVLLNFWATWCAPCLKEMPDLNKLQERYKNRGLEVIVISDESRERLAKFMDKKPMVATSGYLESFDWASLGSERPATFLIDQEGVVQEYFTGSYDYEFFESKILEYL